MDKEFEMEKKRLGTPRTKVVPGAIGLLLGTLLLLSSKTVYAQYFEFEKKRALELQQKNLSSKLQQRLSSRKLSRIRVAVLDNGFGNYEEGGKNLPAGTKLILDPAAALGKTEKGNPLGIGDHGLVMAQTLWAITGYHPTNHPQITLINANGWTNFKNAIDWIVKNEIDIVVNALNFELGNMDDTGFVNEKVFEATDLGILWVNAAGNYHHMTYSGPIISKKGKLEFRFDKTEKRKNIRFQVENDSTPVVMSLSWNDLPEKEETATSKDLDLLVLDAGGKTVLVDKEVDGKKVKVPAVINFRSTGTADTVIAGDTRPYSTLPRENVELTLNRGLYHVEILDRSSNFKKGDKLRLLIMPQRPYDLENLSTGINFIDNTDGFEIFTPADNPEVFTVGDTSPISSLGPNIDKHIKPDVLIADSRVELSDGRKNLMGSSTSAPIFAGILCLMMVENPKLDFDEVTRYLHQIKDFQRTDIPIFQNPATIADDDEEIGEREGHPGR
jgi:hypothetical protein